MWLQATAEDIRTHASENSYKKDLIEKSKNIFLLVQNNILITVVRSKNAFYRRKPKFNIAA